MGYRVAAHCEGMPGTEIAIEEGIDTIEHGMYLHQRPDLLERMARDGQILVPTLSLPLRRRRPRRAHRHEPRRTRSTRAATARGVKRPPMPTWTPLLVDLAIYNVEQAVLTIQAARAAGVTIAMGFDWGPPHRSALELLRMINVGLTPHEGLVAATSAGATALGLEEHVGTVAVGQLADLLVVDGDPLARPEVLLERESIWLVTRTRHPRRRNLARARPGAAHGRMSARGRGRLRAERSAGRRAAATTPSAPRTRRCGAPTRAASSRSSSPYRQKPRAAARR